MAVICRKYNLLFIMTPRTACTAIGELLCGYYGGEFLPCEDIVDSNGRISIQKKHSTLAELINQKILTQEEARSLLKIAAVRNPFDSLVSLYIKQKLKYQPLLCDPTSWVNRAPRYADYMRYAQTHSFNRWILRVSYRKVIKRLFGFQSSMFAAYTQGVDSVLRYEKIETDLKEAFRKAGIPWKVDIPIVNCTDERTNRNYRSYYSRTTAFAVNFAYSEDLRRYGYEF